jgi:hypothetical protein
MYGTCWPMLISAGWLFEVKIRGVARMLNRWSVAS